MYTALTIAGSDSSGGAGIQADIKTMSALGVYATSAVTALTAQNTTGVTDIMEVTPDFLCKQLDAVFTDIYPDAVKIGMLSGVQIMQAVTLKLVEYKAKNIVLDPVMVATSGSRLMKEDSASFMFEELCPLATIVTPNIPEAQALTGLPIANEADMVVAIAVLYEKINERRKFLHKDLLDHGCTYSPYDHETAVLLKGGHSVNDANDYLMANEQLCMIKGERVNNHNTHGTGCTLSSAIASYLAQGCDVETAVRNAKEYITGALKAGLNLGRGSGPLNHMYKI